MSLLWKLLECEYVSLKKSVSESNPRSFSCDVLNVLCMACAIVACAIVTCAVQGMSPVFHDYM